MAIEVQASPACHQSAAESTWGQPPHEFAAGLGILHVEHDVRAVVGLGPVAQHRRLDVVEFYGDRAARKLAAKAVDKLHGNLLTGTDEPADRDSLADWRGHAARLSR